MSRRTGGSPQGDVPHTSAVGRSVRLMRRDWRGTLACSDRHAPLQYAMKVLVPFFAALLLAACGGGGGGMSTPAPSTTPPNATPLQINLSVDPPDRVLAASVTINSLSLTMSGGTAVPGDVDAASDGNDAADGLGGATRDRERSAGPTRARRRRSAGRPSCT